MIDGNATLSIEPSNHPHYRVQYRGGTEYVAKGYVVHLRHHPSVTIAAQTPCRLLHLTYGDVCPLEKKTWTKDR